MKPDAQTTSPRFSPSEARRRRAQWLEVWSARAIAGVAAAVGVATVSVFVFIAVEAGPALSGRIDSESGVARVSPDDVDRIPAETLRSFLGLSPSEFASKTREQLRLLVEVRSETLAEERGGTGRASDPTGWRHLLLPHAGNGQGEPTHLWQPSAASPRFNLIPLWWGTLKVTAIALLVAMPLAITAALHVSQVAAPHRRAWLKPMIESMAGVPAVVMGFLAVAVLAPAVQRILGLPFLFNGFVAGVAVGLAIVPVIFSVAEDALSAVPRDWVRAALALGATPWEAVSRVVLPAAAPGVGAAVLLGLAQALGETMIVMMVSGNAATLSWSLWEPVRTVPVTLALELGETARGGPHYRVLFLLGSLLLALSVVLQGLVRWIRRRYVGRGAEWRS